jgi:ubiquinone/menaquinone biosynthesis C-methylase UbiE
MNNFSSSPLHPVEKAGLLDSRFRILLHNPGKLLKKYVHPGMTVLDLGCGTGYFTLEAAKLVNSNGKVIAADVQQGMLDILKQKAINSKFGGVIEIHKCNENRLNLSEKVDFILAFYAFHEMKYIDNIINDLTLIVKPETKIYISEQKFHVPKAHFNTIISKMENIGFEVCERPKICLSRTVIMKQKSNYSD